MLKQKLGFTLVELLVVITIISILVTIGFFSYNGFQGPARDANRISQLSDIYIKLTTDNLGGESIEPDLKIDIKSGSKTIAYQGYLGGRSLKKIGYISNGKDPKDGKYFTYYITKNGKYIQLLALLEEDDNFVRIPYLVGSKLGVLTYIDNTPIQDIEPFKTDGYIDLNDVGNIELISYLKADDFFSGTGSTFIPVKRFAEVGGKFCKSTNLTCDN